MVENTISFAKTREFYESLGYFYSIWSQVELAVDYAIWKALGTETAEEAHLRSASEKFSDKCKALRALIQSERVPNGERVEELLLQIEDSMRNVFAHSFMATDANSVTFVHRKIVGGKRGKYDVTAYQFSREDFFRHVQSFKKLLFEFNHSVELSEQEFRTFAAMAIPVSTRDAL